MKKIILFLMITFSTFAKAAVDHWETVVYETNTWKYFIPTGSLPTNWNTLAFNDASWNSGQGGFGYGDGDDNTTFSSTISVYQRVVFNIVDITKIDQFLLNVDYDDAFVAYLNGVEIARSNISSSGQPAYNQLANGEHEAIMYQGQDPESFLLNPSLIQILIQNGANVLAIQTHNVTLGSSDMTSRVFLSVGMNVSTTTYGSVPGWFNPPFIFTDTNLPIIVINTENGAIIPDEPKLDATMGIIYNGEGERNYLSDPFNEYYGNIGIEARGSTSQGFPKKQWGFETRDNFGMNNDITVFNMAWDNDWVLYAPYSDKSLIRNVLAYQMGWDLGMYAPRTQLCEVMLNGQYEGVYVFTEKIKRKDGKVGTNSILPEDVSGNELTGDYVLKVDKTTGGGVVAWTSNVPPYPGASEEIDFQLHDPEISQVNFTQYNYIKNYVDEFESALNGPNFMSPTVGYQKYIDVNSFINFFLVNEISKNVDGYRISSFLHKLRESEGGKLVAGPLWDFNLAFGNSDYCNGSTISGWEVDFYQSCSGGLQNPFWWKKLLQDPYYTHLVSCKWREMREGSWHTDSLMQRIDSLANYLEEAQQRNFVRWPVHGQYVWPNNFVGDNYQEDVNYLKQWITNRINWMDANMFDNCLDLAIESQEESAFSIFPNPSNGLFTVQLKQEITNGTLSIYDINGRLVHQKEQLNGFAYQFKLSDVANGVYRVLLQTEQQIITKKLMIQ